MNPQHRSSMSKENLVCTLRCVISIEYIHTGFRRSIRSACKILIIVVLTTR